MKTTPQNKNIGLAYLLSFLGEIYFPIAIWLFFYTRFLNFKEIALLTAIMGITSILLEIPTGVFADIFGRKISIILSFFFFAAAMFLSTFASSFWIFLIVSLLLALENALYSGSMEALVYDTLKEQGKEDTYDHVVSRLEAITWITLFLGSVIGGVLYTLDYRLPYLAQGIILTVGGVVALLLKEPVVDTQHYHWKDIIVKNTQGFRELFKTIKTTRISLSFISIEACYYTASSILGISQARQYGIAPEFVGILFGAGYLLSALASYYFPTFKKIAGMKVLLVLSVASLFASFIFANFVGVIIGSLLIIVRIASSTTFRNIRSIKLNQMFSSESRATAISTFTLLSKLPYTVLAYAIGDYIDKTSPNSLALILGVSGISVLIIIQVIGLVKTKRK